jgi:hypothetical protein
MSQIKDSTINGPPQIVAYTSTQTALVFPRLPFRKVDLDQIAQPRDELSSSGPGLGGVMHISDVILQSSRQALRIAAQCTDEHVAVELHVLAVKLWLAVIKDTELIVEELPILSVNAANSDRSGQTSHKH